jgi:hypothetical protein
VACQVNGEISGGLVAYSNANIDGDTDGEANDDVNDNSHANAKPDFHTNY